MKPTFFAGAGDWRRWLEKNQAEARELLVGFYKKDSGKPSITWPESVDEALCFGWIDGVRRRIDEVSYSIRFTPRKSRSIWSSVNVKRVAELTSLGRVHESGRKAFAAREAGRSGIYSFEQELVAFDPAQEEQLRANEVAWRFFQSQPAWYRRAATWWVISAKRQPTRDKRLATLIEDSAQGQTVSHLTRSKLTGKSTPDL